MPTTHFTGNEPFLSIDGVTICAPWIEITLTPTNTSVETTRGCGTSHVQRNPGLNDTTISMQLGYTLPLSDYIDEIEVGVHTIVYGPEGNAAGKPKHEQSFNITTSPLSQGVDKRAVVFDISGEGADEPVSDIWNGDQW